MIKEHYQVDWMGRLMISEIRNKGEMEFSPRFITENFILLSSFRIDGLVDHFGT